MKKIFISTLLAASFVGAMAQEEPLVYLPGDGIYIEGLPADMSSQPTAPAFVCEAYKAKFNTMGAELASITADKAYNVTKYINTENGELNLITWGFGVGSATNLTIRTYDGGKYSIGDLNPDGKRWTTSYIHSADGVKRNLGVYNHWDCPVTYVADDKLATGMQDAVTVDFGNPHEGLVINNINFTLVTDRAEGVFLDENAYLTVHLRTSKEKVFNIKKKDLKQVNTNSNDGLYYYTVNVSLVSGGFGLPGMIGGNAGDVIAEPFKVMINGFQQEGVRAWLPRTVDHTGLFPTHTSYGYDNAVVDATTDVCINVNGYFNYIGMYGWYDGKVDRGEVVAGGDYVQVYYDPTDADWPGDYFMGEAAFGVESTFDEKKIQIESAPEWISTIALDNSQWVEYGALQLVMVAQPLPDGETGRKGMVTIITDDGASRFSVAIRQGNTMFDGTETGVNTIIVDIPSSGGIYDLQGRKVSNTNTKELLIKNGRKFISKK